MIQSDAVWDQERIYVEIENDKNDSALYSNLQFSHRLYEDEEEKVQNMTILGGFVF